MVIIDTEWYSKTMWEITTSNLICIFSSIYDVCVLFCPP